MGDFPLILLLFLFLLGFPYKERRRANRTAQTTRQNNTILILVPPAYKERPNHPNLGPFQTFKNQRFSMKKKNRTVDLE